MAATISQQLRDIAEDIVRVADEIDRASISPVNAPAGETLPSQPPKPVSPATANPEPKQPASVSAHVSLLAADALQRATELSNSNALVKRIQEIQQATNNEQAQKAVTLAMGEADLLGAASIVLTLMKIRNIVGGSSEGAVIGDTDVKLDMVE